MRVSRRRGGEPVPRWKRGTGEPGPPPLPYKEKTRGREEKGKAAKERRTGLGRTGEG